MNQRINFQNKLELFSEHWSPKVIAEMNDYPFKLAKIKGELTWHDHADNDVDHHCAGGFHGKWAQGLNSPLNEGVCVLTRGQAHKPFADKDCRVLLGEPKGVVNTGDAGDELTDENDVWV